MSHPAPHESAPASARRHRPVPLVAQAPQVTRRAVTDRRTVALLLGGGVTLVITAVLGLGLGSLRIDPGTVLTALTAYDPTVDAHLVVVQSRLPRIVLGIVVGAALGLAGALMQSVTRNPLADPGILGINAGAALCVVLAIGFFGVTDVRGYIWWAFAGAAVTAVLVHLLGAARGSAATPVRMALAGTAVTIVIGSLTQMVLVSNEAIFNTFRFWTIGSLQGRGFDVIIAVVPFVLAGLCGALLLIGPLNAIALGEDVAAGLGTRVAAVRIGSAFTVVLLAGAATAAAGPIGFIGLGAAHMARTGVGNDHRRLIPVSMVLGAALLLTADTLGRALVAPAELQTGVAAALFGGPLFIALVRSRRVAAL